ncbi:MAG: type II toxin-antitoxin system prevent-host-death family antitoxin [Caldilineaceae bacterium]
MMNKIPQIASISDLRNKHLEILARLVQGPVILANRNEPVAVLISPAEWDAIVEELDDYWCALEAAKAELAIARGESQVVQMTEQELDEWLTEDEAVPSGV